VASPAAARRVAHARPLHRRRPRRPGRGAGLDAAAVWRTDEVTPLAPHPNDPASRIEPAGRESFTTFALHIPPGTPNGLVEDTLAAERRNSAEQGALGHLVRLWKLPDGHSLGLWQSRDAEELRAILAALPLAAWLTIETTPLDRHPNDPARASVAVSG
jgi:muconolactone delta-isomerase